jgi:hypothetical protein
VDVPLATILNIAKNNWFNIRMFIILYLIYKIYDRTNKYGIECMRRFSLLNFSTSKSSPVSRESLKKYHAGVLFIFFDIHFLTQFEFLNCDFEFQTI